MADDNPMKAIKLEKVTLNIGAGDSTPALEKGKKLLEKISGKKVVITKTHNRNTFGMAKARPIGIKVTLRGDDARKFLKMALQSVSNKLKAANFDSTGNFSFGIAEYINLPGIKYDPDIGIIGMDVAVTLVRPGYRLSRRMIRPKKIGKSHRIKKEEAIAFAKKQLGVEVSD